MKHTVSTTLKTIMADRSFFSLMVAVMAIAVVCCVYVLLSVESRDIRIVTQYSGFGESHFYRAPWYTLYSFGALFLLAGLINAVAMAKLYGYERRQFAIYLGWVTLALFVIAMAYTIKVFGVAYL